MFFLIFRCKINQNYNANRFYKENYKFDKTSLTFDYTIQDQGTESFDADGIFFSLAEDEQLFVFDGKYFVKGYRHYDYDDAEE